MGTEKNPKQITLKGRLSFPVWTAQEAYERSQKGQYPAKDVASAKPEFNILIEDTQLTKLRDFVTTTFFPHCLELSTAGAKKGGLDAAEIQAITDQIMLDNFGGKKAVYNTPLKELTEKSAELAPECVASVKIIGNPGVDMEKKAVVNEEKELAVPDPDQLTYPVIRPINETVHQLYPGAMVAVTVNLYAYHNGKLPGFSAGGSTCVFWADADRFGGGVAVDEDAIFSDD